MEVSKFKKFHKILSIVRGNSLGLFLFFLVVLQANATRLNISFTPEIISKSGIDTSKLYHFSHLQMGTKFNLYIRTTDSLSAQYAAEKAFQKLDSLNLILSDYREDSEINKLCRTGGLNQSVSVSTDLFELLKISIEAQRLSNGNFDISVGTLTQLWRRMKRQKKLPDTIQLAEAKSKTGIQYIVLNPENQSVMITKQGLRIDFGGIGKGYAEDKMMQILQENGIKSAMIEAGGNILVSKGSWQITINQKIYPLSDCGISTSGDLFQFVEIDGKKYSHIVHPKHGIRLATSRQVSVVAPNSTIADWASTALYLMPSAKAKKLAKRLKIRIL